MGMPSMPELLIILAIIVLLFGAKKIPDLAKGIGSGIKNFKKAVKDDDDETAVSSNEKTEQINKSETNKQPETKIEESTKA